MDIKKTGYIILFTLLLSAQGVSCASRRYGRGLTAEGSNKSAFTIFTNPAQDCSKGMNISWGSPLGKYCMIEIINDSNLKRAFYTSEDPEICETFDSIYSKLADGTNVYESHVFNKHNFEIFNLDPDCDYKYRIITSDEETNLMEYSDFHYFRTAGADSWKAAIIGDFHHYSPMWSRLDAAMEMIEVLDEVSDGFDWILSTGDQCAWGGSYNFWTELSEQPAYKNFMWATVQGNHDHQTRENDKSDAFFRDSHFYPANGYSGQEGVSYWFKYGDVLFFMLNNEAMRTAASLNPVFNWMERVIKRNHSKYIVVVQHNEWLIGTNGANSQLDRFRNEFDRLGVDLAISGNNHAYLRTFPLRDREPVEPEDGIFYVVTPSSDDNRGRQLKPVVANEDIIAERWSEGARTVGGMIMDVNPDRIIMTLYDRYGDVKDSFTVPAKR
ncbi:MAG: metallophosphoesterase [Paramuribaculum sp.]|nr:metallophosphoesterase [Paramuribaculum sp.]